MTTAKELIEKGKLKERDEVFFPLEDGGHGWGIVASLPTSYYPGLIIWSAWGNFRTKRLDLIQAPLAWWYKKPSWLSLSQRVRGEISPEILDSQDEEFDEELDEEETFDPNTPKGKRKRLEELLLVHVDYEFTWQIIINMLFKGPGLGSLPRAQGITAAWEILPTTEVKEAYLDHALCFLKKNEDGYDLEQASAWLYPPSNPEIDPSHLLLRAANEGATIKEITEQL